MKLAAGALIGCLALGWWLVGGRTTTETDSDVPTFVIESGPFLKQVEAEGNLEAVQATTISPPAQVQGPLRIAWLAEDGIRVAEDEVVVIVIHVCLPFWFSHLRGLGIQPCPSSHSRSDWKLRPPSSCRLSPWPSVSISL